MAVILNLLIQEGNIFIILNDLINNKSAPINAKLRNQDITHEKMSPKNREDKDIITEK